jgi:hypothetical protein
MDAKYAEIRGGRKGFQGFLYQRGLVSEIIYSKKKIISDTREPQQVIAKERSDCGNLCA